ncbi:MAG: hypothetical protein WAZ18_04840 [Alphaproteobacteria bacterium]
MVNKFSRFPIYLAADILQYLEDSDIRNSAELDALINNAIRNTQAYQGWEKIHQRRVSNTLNLIPLDSILSRKRFNKNPVTSHE